MLSVWRALCNSLPGTCQVCGRWPSEPVCEGCATRFQGPLTRCQHCAAPLHGPARVCGACVAQSVPTTLQRCAAAVDYAYPWDGLIARFKFRGEPGWASPFARRLLRAPHTLECLSQCDVLVPVPLSAVRLAERGYNQAWELAKALRRLGRPSMPAVPDALVRLVDRPDQHSLPREQRLRNVQDAFAVHPAHVPLVRKAQVLLVDDVSTTGATLQAAAQALRQSGAAGVSAVVFARTPPG